MSMMLVRQEVMGNELSAVMTVLKSDAKREGVNNLSVGVRNRPRSRKS